MHAFLQIRSKSRLRINLRVAVTQKTTTELTGAASAAIAYYFGHVLYYKIRDNSTTSKTFYVKII